MKINRQVLFNYCNFEKRECYNLAVRLSALDGNDLINAIKNIKVWTYGKSDLGLWADVLDRLDTILAEGVTKVGLWTLKLEQAINKELRGQIISILEFTGHLMEHSYHTYLYSSWEHIIELFSTTDLVVLNSVLELIYIFSKTSNYLSCLDPINRKMVHQRLNSIVDSWGSKEHQPGFRLAECLQPNYKVPESAGTVQYLMNHESSSDLFSNVERYQTLTLTNLHLHPETLSQQMENLILEHNLTNTAEQMVYFPAMTLCVYFTDPKQRKQLIYAKMQALGILAVMNELEEKYITWDILAELVDVAKLPLDEEYLKACALRSLSAIIQCGKFMATNIVNII